MKAIIFDTGPIISLGINNLLWLLKELKKRFKGEFCITESVRKELITKPLKGKRFKFEAMQVQSLIENGVLKVVKDKRIKKRTNQLLDLANKTFYIHKHPMQTFHEGEMETLAAAIELDINIIVVDERVTRMIIERPGQLERRLEKKMHADVKVDKNRLRKFHKAVSHLKLIRSIELVSVAFEMGLLNRYLVKIPNAKKELLDSLLWAIKLNGCSITDPEIKEIKREVLRKSHFLKY